MNRALECQKRPDWDTLELWEGKLRDRRSLRDKRVLENWLCVQRIPGARFRTKTSLRYINIAEDDDCERPLKVREGHEGEQSQSVRDVCRKEGKRLMRRTKIGENHLNACVMMNIHPKRCCQLLRQFSFVF